MPRFGGEINLWLKYWRTGNLSSEAKQSGNNGGGVGVKKKKKKGDKRNQSDNVTPGLGAVLRRRVGVWSMTAQVKYSETNLKWYDLEVWPLI